MYDLQLERYWLFNVGRWFDVTKKGGTTKTTVTPSKREETEEVERETKQYTLKHVLKTEGPLHTWNVM